MTEICTYPECNCPYDMGADSKCCRGFEIKNGDATTAEADAVGLSATNALLCAGIRERFTENAEQFDELMVEMLNENEKLARINTMWRHRMQAMIRRIRKDNSFYTQIEIDSWFDADEYPKSA